MVFSYRIILIAYASDICEQGLDVQCTTF